MIETDRHSLLAFMQALLIGWVLGFSLVGATASPPADTHIGESF